MPRRRTFARAPRRATEWFDTLVGPTTFGASTQSRFLLDDNVLSDEKKGMTIARMILDLTFQAATVNVTGILDFGICFIEGDAEAALIFPDPNIDDEQPGWWYRNRIVLQSVTAEAAGAVHLFKDLKTRRKYDGEDIRVGMIFNVGSATGVEIAGLMRLLALKA